MSRYSQDTFELMIAFENKSKYLKAPTFAQIREFMDELGISTLTRFERFYGIPHSTLRMISYGGRELPAKFWHIIYEKIKPAYGVGFLPSHKELVENIATKRLEPTKVIKTKPKTEIGNRLLERLSEL